MGNAQIMKVNILGGAEVIHNGTVTIDAGTALTFRITNTITQGCGDLRVQGISISNTANFSLSNTNPTNVKPNGCKGNNNLDFTVTANGSVCGSPETFVYITTNIGTFIMTFKVIKSPIISVLGGSPSADINNGTTTTTATNGTYYGIVEEGAVKTRNFVIANTGSCPLNISAITSSLAAFQVAGYVLTPIATPPYYTPAALPTNIAPGSHVIFIVTFVAPTGATGTQTSTISISNTANTAFTFNVSAEMFNVNIPGPGGVTANFRLWLKSTRGVVFESSDVSPKKVKNWKDLGVNGKSAEQTNTNLQPTYLDNAANNINFNPVIKFENNGGTLNQYLENADNGFYSQDIFIVMVPDLAVSTSSGMTIFSGTVAGNITPENYVNDANEVTGVGLGNFTANLSGERLWYNQGSATSNPHYSLPASSSRAYDKAGIINARNKTVTPSDGMSILFNTVDDAITATKTIATFANFGYIEEKPDPEADFVWGTPYKIGKNANGTYGNLNGRVAEIMTFAERVPDADRPKIETYLAIKYGITLGATTAEKNYVNSAGIAIWDITANAGYNYNVAGIGKDNASDLNQKQSKSINDTNEVTIGLGGIFATNSANSNDFSLDKEFLVWGCNNDVFTGTNTNTVTISTDITTSLTRIDRKWKIVESGGDVENIFIGIPEAVFSSFSKNADEEFVLIVADNANFGNADIIDVIPLKASGTNLQTWYDFDGTKFFTFGKAPKLSGNRQVNIATGDYLVGEYALNLNINAFTISAWVKSAPSASVRTIMAKGSKLQLRLNAANKVEVMVDDDATPRFTSDMVLNDSKWHNITFVYASGTVFLYIDGILDKSVQGVDPPTPNYNHFSIGAVYIDKNQILRPFLGDLDEVYVWDQGLTQDQVRYLMNQEIEKTTGNFVTGKTIPQAATSNEVTTIPWSTLRAYYDFNTFYGSTVDGKTDLRNFLRIKYLNKTKPLTNIQTAPLPYISAANGTWDTSGTWQNNDVQKLPNSLGLNGASIDWNIVQTTHNITSGDRDITLLALKNNSGTITIADPLTALDENNAGQGLRVTHYLELDGVIDLVGESQLIQDEGSILDQDSGGYLERDQQGTANSFNYNYWSSSVGPISGNSNSRGAGVASTNANFTLFGVLKDGSSNINFQAPYTAADSGPSTPITISTYWLYTFNAGNNNYSSWNRINQNMPLLPGEGYTMKGSSGAV
ncbi:MAG: hypothetical protein GZ086_13540, partial [Gelidibacter sp.]|nr:hypothetical protein [Gelidibacter sp.]